MFHKNPLAAKLSHGVTFTDSDLAQLDSLTTGATITSPRNDLIQRGDAPSHVHLILDGFACRYKILRNGTRSIMAYLLPGDICDVQIAVLDEMDHSIATLSECTLVRIPRQQIDALLAESPAILRAFWWTTLVDEAILREWLVSMGRRRSDVRMAHLFCELQARLAAVGHATEQGYAFPVTQEELADTLGITVIHAHRTLQTLRRQELIGLQDRWLTIPDLGALRDFARFEPDYLHMNRKGTAQ